MHTIGRAFRSLTLVLIMGLFAGSVVMVSPQPASALSGGEFNAGNIIDDSVFNNKNSMGIGDIQNFLNSKVPSCDNWGTKPYAGTTRRAYSESRGIVFPLTCMKDYYENTSTHQNNLEGRSIPGGAKSAAHIIWEVSQNYNINPQVMLALISREQALITDDWPWPIQFKSAAGYSCPDSGPDHSIDCNGYYGFAVQADAAAWQFRHYADQPGSFSYKAGRYNTIQWSPQPSCGTSSVFIQNQATASLYNYAPYRPNQAALDNLYGTGDGCSSYANRNFWRDFSNWFGSTQGDPISGAVYRLHNPYTGDWLLTLSWRERDDAIWAHNYSLYDGTAFQGYPSYEDGAVPVYRLSKANTHLFTTSESERSAATSQYGFVDEGAKFYAKASQVSNSRPVYRLSKNGKYFYTVNAFEKDDMAARGYANEGIAFYSYSESTKMPVYRLSRGGQHFFTQSSAEKDVAQQMGYVYEGNAFEAQTAATGDALPIYRLERNGKYFYTQNRGERDAAVLMYRYRSEGAAWFGYVPNYAGTLPILRSAKANPEDHLYTKYPEEHAAATSQFNYVNEGTNFNL